MKRLLAVFLSFVMAFSCLGITSLSAINAGDPLGWVLYSDVIAYIDGYPIKSYNIDGYTYIIAEDLVSYGFNVEWRGSEAKLIIHTDRTATPKDYNSVYKHTLNEHVPGTPAFEYLYTNITVWIGERQIPGYNIGGNTCICMDHLAEEFGLDYIWYGAHNLLALITHSEGWSDIELPPNRKSEAHNQEVQPPEQSESQNRIAPQFKAAMDSYEVFFDEYISFMQKYKANPSSLALLGDYMSFMAQYADTMEKMNAICEQDLNEAELAYYIEVTGRITRKLLALGA